MAKSIAILLAGIFSSLSIAHVPPGANSVQEAVSAPSEAISVLSELPAAQIRVIAAVPVPLSHATSENQSQEDAPPVHSVTESVPLLAVIDQEDIRPEDRVLLNKALRWLPASCRESLRHLVVRYDPAAERGQSTSSTILLRGGLPEQQFIAVLIHECGHIIDLGALKGDAKSGESAYPDGSIPTYNSDPSARFYAISWKNSEEKRNLARAEDFVSGYAREDPFEDFAESFIMYALHNAEFRLLAERNGAITQKYAFMHDVIFGGRYEEKSEGTLLGLGHRKRVWDTTKLAHNLVF